MENSFIYDSRGLFLPDTHTELRLQQNLRRQVTLRSGNLVNNVRTASSGVSARACRGGVFGFSSAAECSEAAARRVLSAAMDNAAFLDGRTRYGKPSFPPVAGGRIERDNGFADCEQREYIDFLKVLDEYIVNHCPNIKSRTLNAYTDRIEKTLVCSDGAEGHHATPRSYIYVFLTGEHRESGNAIDVYEVFGGCGGFGENFPSPQALFGGIDLLYSRLMDKCEGIYADAGEKLCVLTGELAGMLAHEAVGHTVESDLVMAGSVAASLLGKEVASPLVSLTDFAHSAFGETAPLPVYLDDEGVIATDAPIIKDGILVGYMHNRESAAHYGVSPCGNARAYAYSDEPLVRMRNTAIHPGTSRLEDMIASVEDGYYLISTNNGQADTTGEFMFGISLGYEIKNGKRGRAILDTTISGVAFTMLKTVDMVGDEMTWLSSGMCGKKQPMPVGMGGPALRCRVMIGGR